MARESWKYGTSRSVSGAPILFINDVQFGESIDNFKVEDIYALLTDYL